MGKSIEERTQPGDENILRLFTRGRELEEQRDRIVRLPEQSPDQQKITGRIRSILKRTTEYIGLKRR